MAEKRIEVIVDIESKDVQFATDRVLSLQQQIRLLTKEIQNVDPSSESFRVLSKKLNDTQDQLKSVRARSGELFQTFSLLPGPIGEISAKLDGGVSLLKTFSQFKLSDLTNQFKGLGRDLKDAFLSLGFNLLLVVLVFTVILPSVVYIFSILSKSFLFVLYPFFLLSW